MSWLRRKLRFHTTLQLMFALESAEETLVGGQAVLEGVMMRSPHAWGIAVRKPSGEMVTHSEPLERPSEKSPWKGWPLDSRRDDAGAGHDAGIQGPALLGQCGLGRGSGRRNVKDGEDAPKEKKGKKVEISGWVAALNIALSLGFFIFMYKFLPYLAAKQLRLMDPQLDNRVLFSLVEGGSGWRCFWALSS